MCVCVMVVWILKETKVLSSHLQSQTHGNINNNNKILGFDNNKFIKVCLYLMFFCWFFLSHENWVFFFFFFFFFFYIFGLFNVMLKGSISWFWFMGLFCFKKNSTFIFLWTENFVTLTKNKNPIFAVHCLVKNGFFFIWVFFSAT